MTAVAPPDPPHRPQLAVSAAIFRTGRVLLVRRARSPGHGLYSLPGGRVEFGDMLAGPIAKQLDRQEPKAVEKLNATIAKKQDKLRIAVGLPFDFDLGKWSLPAGSVKAK